MCITAECFDPTKVGIWWRDDAEWKLYSRESIGAILQALLKGTPSLRLDLPFKTSSFEQSPPRTVEYLIDLSKMEQKNVASGHKRAIKLVLPSSSGCCACNHGKPVKDQQEVWRIHDSLPGGGEVQFRAQQESCILVIRSGNIAERKVDGEADAVVNPCATNWRGSSDRRLADTARCGSSGSAISSRHGGAGRRNVAAALHNAAGPKLQEPVERSVRSAASKSGRINGDAAIVTPRFNLPASHVVHTFAAPMYKKDDEASSCAKLKKTYDSALTLAAANSMQYLAFSAISCGAGGFPIDLAVRVALQAIFDSSSYSINGVLEIHFIFLEPEVLLAWMAQASKRFFKVA